MALNDIRQSIQSLQALYTDMSPTSLRDKALQAYTNRVLDKLGVILNQQIDNAKLADVLQGLLTKNWALVNGTALCYTALPTHDVTSLICDIAQFVADEKKLTPIEVLMPGITRESVRDGYNDLGADTNLKTLLQTHI